MTYKRECGDCTACCDGWLWGKIGDSDTAKVFQPGRPCHYKCEKGCAIYEERPNHPCKDYSCQWLLNKEIPEWFKPNISGVIISEKEWGPGKKYFEVVETGKKIDSTILAWLFVYHYTTDHPMRIEIDHGWYNFGPKEFLDCCNGIKCLNINSL
jgi:hypothetical protein